ncbi:MAG: hypothetical protein ACK4N5_04165 [Myxococcales bacterium]
MPEWVTLDEYARRSAISRDAVWDRIRQHQLSYREANGVHLVQEPEPLPRPDALVPSSYAEKAMASLLRLHDELMTEKEARFGLMQKLMEREQTVAELKSYVKLLEARLSDAPLRQTIAEVTRAEPAATPAPVAPAPAAPREEAARSAPVATVPPPPERPVRPEGWRNW